MLYGPLSTLTNARMDLATSLVSFERVFEVLDLPVEIRDSGFVARNSDPAAAGLSEPLIEEIFKLKEVNAVGKSVEHPLGYAIPKLAEVHLPKPPEFSQARAAVEKDFLTTLRRGRLLTLAGGGVQ
jgi:hypothetical protein